MTEKQLTYTVKIDLPSAQAQATQLRALFQQSLQNIQVNLGDPSAFKNALATETAATRAAAQERIQIAKSETAERTQAAKLAASAGIEEEKRVTAAFKAEIQQQNLAQRQAQQATQQRTQSPVGGGQSEALGGLGNALAGYLTIQGARQVAQQTMAFAQLGTEVRRADVSFKIISGGASQAAANLNAVKEAAAGTVTTLAAEQLATQALNLHLASTAQGLGDVTRAAREIALVSPTIHDMGDAMTQLSLFASNVQSYQRADQLGLSASEVRQRIKELQAANGDLDDSQAKLLASTQILNEKFGTLLTTTEAQASGVEKLKVAFSDLWAEMAKGSIGKGVDNVFAGLGNSLNEGLAYAGTKDNSVISKALNDVMAKAKANADDFKNIPLLGSSASGQLAGMEAFKKVFDQVNAGVASGIPIASEYQKQIDEIAISVIRKNQISDEELQKIHEIQTAYASAAVAQRAQLATQQATAQQSATQKAQQERVAGLLEPINKLGNNLKDIGLDNFFLSLQDGLSKSAELTANETNRVAELRQQLVSIGQAVAEKNGVIGPGQRSQVDAINAQIEALSQAAKLNKELQQAKPAAGQDLEGIYTRLNAIVAQTSGIMDQTANSARALGDAIAQSGSASAEQMAQLGDLAAEANQADFSRVAQSLQELNQGSLDAVPGVSSLREELTSFYDTLASGQGLTDEQAATLAGLAAEADALGGSSSALADIQSQLGFKFLESHDYAAALVEQIANLSALYGAGSIGADQFAGGMGVLTGQLYGQLDAANALTPKLRELLALLGAVAGARAAPGQAGGGIYTGNPGEQRPGLSPGFVSGQRQAEAAAAAARSKADSSARDEARAANAKAAKGAQSAFEHAAQETEKAFEKVTDNLVKSLEKVEGLFSPSKVTAEDMALSKAGLYTPKADELLRQVKSAAENDKDKGRFASQIAQAREALSKIGVAPAENLKALAAQLEQAWSSSALFANKDNLKLINADAVKAAISLQDRAAEGKKNILEYFGATIDAVKEKFKAGDPEIVAAVGAELGASNDKNIQALGDQLKEGGQKIIDKVLALAQASIDKTVGSLGSGVSAGGGGGITVPTVSVGPTTGKAGTTGGAGGYLDGTAFAGGVVPVTAQITNILPSATPLAPIPVTAQVSSVDASKANVESAKTSLIERLVLLLSPTIDVSKTDTATARTTLVERMPLTLTPWIDTSKANTKTARDLLIEQMPLHLTPFITTTAVDTETARTSLVERLPLVLTPFIDTKLVDVSTARTELIEKLALPLNPTIDVSKTSVESAKTGLIERMVLSLNPIVDVTQTDVTAARTTLIEKMAVVVNPQVDASKTDVAAARTALIEKLALPLNPSIDISKTDVETAKTSLIEKMVLQLNPQIDTSKTDVETAKTALTERMVVVVNPQVDASKTDVSAARTLLIERLALPLTPYIDTSNIAGKIQEAISKASSDVEQEGADGKIRKKSALDFTATASQITGSLSKAMGGQADFLRTIGDNASTFIGFGMTDHDFSATASTLIGSMTASFTTEQARTQLIAAGAALSGAVFAGFQQSLAYSPWLSAIVAEVVSQAATSLNSSLQDSLKPQALGF